MSSHSKFSSSDVLSALGLERHRTGARRAFVVIGLVSAGAAVGAGAMLLGSRYAGQLKPALAAKLGSNHAARHGSTSADDGSRRAEDEAARPDTNS